MDDPQTQPLASHGRHFWLSFFLAAFVSLGGAAGGSVCGKQLTPDSTLASIAWFCMIPAAFWLSLATWQGLFLVVSLFRALFGFARGTMPNEQSLRRSFRWKSILAIPVATLVCALSGLIIGAAASRMGYFFVLCTSAGAALGFFIWILAQWDLWPMMFTSDDPNSTSPW
ncbi:MAG: hypothetical protein KBG84_16415 [Planctomycetes bacterium]|nr:hypothetical protein [Planctomycetota bacterium]